MSMKIFFLAVHLCLLFDVSEYVLQPQPFFHKTVCLCFCRVTEFKKENNTSNLQTAYPMCNSKGN